MNKINLSNVTFALLLFLETLNKYHHIFESTYKFSSWTKQTKVSHFSYIHFGTEWALICCLFFVILTCYWSCFVYNFVFYSGPYQPDWLSRPHGPFSFSRPFLKRKSSSFFVHVDHDLLLRRKWQFELGRSRSWEIMWLKFIFEILF